MAAAKVMRGECSIEDIKFHNPEDGNYYGKPVVRQDALGKVCGLTDYGDDQALKMPQGVLYAAIVQPKVTHHAKILAIHTEEAEKMPGVLRLSQQKILSQQAELTSWLRVNSMREVLL